MTFLLIVTVTSMLIAAIMSVIAWRLAGDERRRSDARVAALAAEIHETDGDAGRVLSDPDVGRVPLDPPQHQFVGRVLSDLPHSRVQKDPAYNSNDPAYTRDPEPTYSTLLAARPTRSGPRPLAAFIAGALVVGAIGATAVVLPRTLTRTSRVVSPPAAPLPLELVALGHERVGDQLTVHGVIRNPPTGSAIDQLTAVVFVVAPDGEYLASGRSTVGDPALEPGRETTFAVTVPGAGDVGRYRVSFRIGDRLVPHLDRRHES